jgi:S-(hydroxymethyl)glutathione synthase
MFLYVDGFPDSVPAHAPTLDREADVGAKPDRWVFTRSKHPMVTIPNAGLPPLKGWAPTANA